MIKEACLAQDAGLLLRKRRPELPRTRALYAKRRTSKQKAIKLAQIRETSVPLCRSHF